MNSFITWIIASSFIVSGNKSIVSEDFAEAVAQEVIETPLTKDPRLDALVFIETAWRETEYDMTKIGDHGLAQCALQVHVHGKSLDGWTPKEVRENAHKCVHTAMHIMKYSFRICHHYPLAPYASGTCTNKAGIRISNFRMMEVQKAYRQMAPRFIEIAEE